MDVALRQIMIDNGACHPQMMNAYLFLARKHGGRGLKSHELVYRAARIKMAIHLAVSSDASLQRVAEYEAAKSEEYHSDERDAASSKHGRALFVEAQRFSLDLGLELELASNGAVAHFHNTEGEYVELDVFDPVAVKRVVDELQQRHLRQQINASQWQGQFLNKFHGANSEMRRSSLDWLKWMNMPIEVEVTLFEAMAQLLKTRVFDDIRRPSGVPAGSMPRKCRMCFDAEENVPHILAGCSVLSLTQYLYRHNAGLRPLYWWLRKKYGIDDRMKAWHVNIDPEPMVDNDRVTLWWDLPVSTAKRVKCNRPDLRVLLKQQKKLFVIEFGAPWDGNVHKRREEKEQKYKPLIVEMAAATRGTKITQVTLIIGALGSVQDLEVELAKVVDEEDVKFVARRMQRAVVCGSAGVLNTFKGFTRV